MEVVIKPHHFMDIIKLYGSGINEFVPDLKMQHDFYRVANMIIHNPATILKLTTGGDDICRPCLKYRTVCVDTIDHRISKDEYNRYLDQKIIELYKNKSLQGSIDSILVDEKLAVYSDYQWFVKLYRNNKTIEDVQEFSDLLEKYLNSLKHYSVKTTTPKSNVLIAIYLLNDFTIDECAQSIFKNVKYLEYVDYVIENSTDISLLYEIFMKLIRKNYFVNKEYIPNVLFSFVKNMEFYDNDNDIYINYLLYSFLCLGDSHYLDILSHYRKKDKILHMVERETKNILLLEKLYRYCGEVDKLWNLLINSNYKYLLSENIDILKDKYNDQLYHYFINEFYEIIKKGKKRDTYHKAVVNIKYISKLNHGWEYVQKIIDDLKKSDYQKCSVLFDEMNAVLD